MPSAKACNLRADKATRQSFCGHEIAELFINGEIYTSRFFKCRVLTAFWPASSSDIFGDWLIFCRRACPGLPICCRLLSWQADWQVRNVIQPVNLISSYTMFNVHRAPSCRENNARGTRPGFFTPSSQVKISCTDLAVCAQSLSAPWVSVCRSETRKPCRALDEL